ncbi:hypothetical protein [Pedococcus bigeumensis]|uniref:hypothetical protein n=1 Tax=Pedococcus bigeumensis TaxID=433644 RepID=UPI002FE8701D
MSKKINRPTGSSRHAPKKAPRYLWTSTGARLFDADGREYEPYSNDLPVKEVNRFVRRGQVPFAVHECGGGLEWFEVADLPALWKEVEPDFDTGEDWEPPADAPGAQPYRGSVWKAIGGRDLVVVLSNE